MAMEGDGVAASACACARDPADSIVKQIVAQSTTIASGREDRALFWHRANAIRVPFRRSAALTLTLPPPSCVAPGKALYARRQSADKAAAAWRSSAAWSEARPCRDKAVFGMISAMEAISLTRDLPIAGLKKERKK